MCIKITIITFSSCLLVASIIILIYFGIQFNGQRIVQSGSMKHICNSTDYNFIQNPSYCYYNSQLKTMQCYPPSCDVFLVLDCNNTNPNIKLRCDFTYCTNTNDFNNCVKDTPLNTTYNVYTFNKKPNDYHLENDYNKLVNKYKNSNMLPLIIAFSIIAPVSLIAIIVTSISFCCWCF